MPNGPIDSLEFIIRRAISGSYNGNIYLDLCDDAWRVVEVAPRGWRVIDRPPVKFLRPAFRSAFARA
jgi:hypothetical protein